MSPPTPTDNDGPPSSQELPQSSQHSTIFSSPPRLSSNDPETQKERRKPSITPRKFTRFFTPRSHESGQLSSVRQALQDVTGRSHISNQSSPLRPFRSTPGQENGVPKFTRDLKRRKIYHTPESTPDDQVESKHKDLGCKVQDSFAESDERIPSSPCVRAFQKFDSDLEEEYGDPPEPVRPIKQMVDRGLAAQVLQMSLGSARTSRHYYEYPVNGKPVLQLHDYELRASM